MKLAFAALACSLCSLIVTAQTTAGGIESRKDSTVRSHAYTAAVGASHQLDTYLSPRNYQGYQVSLLRETIRHTRLCHGRISFQTLWQATFSQTHPLYSTRTDWGGHIGYDALWHYGWNPAKGLRLMAGAAVGADIGFLYNSSGGNNPAQGRFNIDLSASVMAIYRFRIGQKRLSLRYQANMPLLGMMFSPDFGQSYYEIASGYWNGNMHFTHLGNAFSLWQQLTFDIPLGRRLVLRTGYLCDIRQSRVGNIKVHDRSHSFMIGFVHYFRRAATSCPVLL